MCHTENGRMKSPSADDDDTIEQIRLLRVPSFSTITLQLIHNARRRPTLLMGPGPRHHAHWSLYVVMSKTVLTEVYTILQLAMFRGAPPKIYRFSYTGALLSYAIVVVKSLGVPQANAAWARRAFADENVQYMILAVFWCVLCVL